MKNLNKRIQELQRGALSDDWSRREEAGFSLRDLMEEHFDEVMRLTESWVKHPSERVRRAACLACMQRKAFTDSQRVRKVLHRLTTLMKDDSLYVRKCCGPFVVGYLGYTYPSLTIPWLKKQARIRDLNARANVAKAFSQALGGRHPWEGLEILAILAIDDRSRVRQAVSASARNIVRRKGTTLREMRKSFPTLFACIDVR